MFRQLKQKPFVISNGVHMMWRMGKPRFADEGIHLLLEDALLAFIPIMFLTF